MWQNIFCPVKKLNGVRKIKFYDRCIRKEKNIQYQHNLQLDSTILGAV